MSYCRHSQLKSLSKLILYSARDGTIMNANKRFIRFFYFTDITIPGGIFRDSFLGTNIPFSTKPLLILLMSAFFAKNQRFLAKIVPLLKAIM